MTSRHKSGRLESADRASPAKQDCAMLDKYSMPQKLHAKSGGQFHVMAKPAGSSCNLDCKYCFYLSKETLRNGPGTGQMSEDSLEVFIKQYIEGVTGPQVV